jgi:ribosomal protein S8
MLKEKGKAKPRKKTKTREWISQTNNDQKHNRNSCQEALKMNLELFILSTKQSIQNSKVAYTMCIGGNIQCQASMATFS